MRRRAGVPTRPLPPHGGGKGVSFPTRYHAHLHPATGHTGAPTRNQRCPATQRHIYSACLKRIVPRAQPRQTAKTAARSASSATSRAAVVRATLGVRCKAKQPPFHAVVCHGTSRCIRLPGERMGCCWRGEKEERGAMCKNREATTSPNQRGPTAENGHASEAVRCARREAAAPHHPPCLPGWEKGRRQASENQMQWFCRQKSGNACRLLSPS